MNKLIGVNIINWNGVEDTLECLRALTKVEGAEQLDILVIDNGSKDSTEIQQIKKAFPSLSYIVNESNLGFTGANNQGFKWAEERSLDYIMILNNDVTVDKNFVKRLLQTIEQYPKAIVSPKIVQYGSDRILNIGGIFRAYRGGGNNWHRNKLSSDYQELYYPDYLSGCCWIMPTSAVQDIGLFDDAYFAYYEDLDYCVRAKEKGYKIIVDGSAVIYHKHSASTKGSYIKIYFGIRNLIYFFKKHNYSLLSLPIALLVFSIGCVRRYKNFAWVPDAIKGTKDGLINRMHHYR